MRVRSHKMVVLLILVLLACSCSSRSMQSAVAEPEDADFSGTITVTGTSVAAGIDWSWGRGTLTLLDGSQHPFTASGLDVAAVGIRQATGVGYVYHLKQLEDFEGQYVMMSGGIAVGGGTAGTLMQNAQGVVIGLTGVSRGIDVRFAVSGMEVKLVK